MRKNPPFSLFPRGTAGFDYEAKDWRMGLNFQNCAHVTFFPSHSYEQYYQGVRRCWRYGQKSR